VTFIPHKASKDVCSNLDMSSDISEVGKFRRKVKMDEGEIEVHDASDRDVIFRKDEGRDGSGGGVGSRMVSAGMGMGES
jgi:hypothetical protein